MEQKGYTFVGSINDEGQIEFKVKPTGDKKSIIETIIVPGYVTLNGKRYNTLLTNESFSDIRVKSIHLEKGVTIKDNTYPFYFCKCLQSITVDKYDKNYCSIDGALYNKSVTYLISCPVIKKGFKLPRTVIDCSYALSSNIDLNMHLLDVIKKRNILSIISALRLHAKKSEKRVRKNTFTTESEFSFWKKELDKCMTVEDYDRYLRLYDNPSNYYIGQAISRRRILINKKSASNNKSNFDFDDIKSVIFGILYIAAPVIIGLTLRYFYEEYKDASQNDRSQSTYQQTTINTTGFKEDEPANNNDDDDYEDDHQDQYRYSPNNPTVTYPYNNTPEIQPNNVQDNNDDRSRWDTFYRNQYAELERQAERDYESLTHMGARYNNNGTPDGFTGRDDPYIAQQIYYFRQKQHEMRNLRHEAATKGIIISESVWESANVNI